MATQPQLFGQSIKRREDPRLITGKGTYVDDVKLPGTTHAAFVRSPHAHARIKSIDTTAARNSKGVVAVYTGKDLVAGGVKPLPVGWLLPDIKIPPYNVLAVDKARYMGDAVAVVIAETPYLARDAADLVEVDYEPLPAVVEGIKAAQAGAPQLHNEAPNNVSFKWSLGDKQKT
ncbi:MAG: xanthine dehydrogenase family protein molybdopterin-binding subunit, partial [Deltaproteobacteria bacterium]